MSVNDPNVKLTDHLKIVAPDPVDADEAFLNSIRLDPTQAEAVVKIPVTLQCRKPSRHEFVRVHPQLELLVGAIEMKDEADGGFYLVDRAMMASLGDELKSFVMRPYLNKVGTLRLWPIRQPDSDGRQNEWHRTAAVAAARAVDKWLRVTPNRDLGAYEIFEAVNQGTDPVWPDLDLTKMMKLAFAERGRVVDSPDHPLVKQLYGRL